MQKDDEVYTRRYWERFVREDAGIGIYVPLENRLRFSIEGDYQHFTLDSTFGIRVSQLLAMLDPAEEAVLVPWLEWNLGITVELIVPSRGIRRPLEPYHGGPYGVDQVLAPILLFREELLDDSRIVIRASGRPVEATRAATIRERMTPVSVLHTTLRVPAVAPFILEMPTELNARFVRFSVDINLRGLRRLIPEQNSEPILYMLALVQQLEAIYPQGDAASGYGTDPLNISKLRQILLEAACAPGTEQQLECLSALPASFRLYWVAALTPAGEYSGLAALQPEAWPELRRVGATATLVEVAVPYILAPGASAERLAVELELAAFILAMLTIGLADVSLLRGSTSFPGFEVAFSPSREGLITVLVVFPALLSVVIARLMDHSIAVRGSWVAHIFVLATSLLTCLVLALLLAVGWPIGWVSGLALFASVIGTIGLIALRRIWSRRGVDLRMLELAQPLSKPAQSL